MTESSLSPRYDDRSYNSQWVLLVIIAIADRTLSGLARIINYLFFRAGPSVALSGSQWPSVAIVQVLGQKE